MRMQSFISVSITQNNKEVNVTLTDKPKRSNFLTQTEYAKEWRRWMSKNDPEFKIKKAQKMREYRSKNVSKFREQYKQSYTKNSESRKKHQRNKWSSDIEKSRKKLMEYGDKNIQKLMLRSVKARALKENITYNLNLDYIKSIWPKNNLCPIFGCELKRNRKGQSRNTSPSLDRIIPEKGYVEGNVVVVSFKANRIKNDGTVEDLRKVLHFYENQTNFL
jgi:hypothetical protein